MRVNIVGEVGKRWEKSANPTWFIGSKWDAMSEREKSAEKELQRGGASRISEKPDAFRGNFTHTIDDKGRVSLPATFRQLVQARGEESVVVTNYISEGSRCLEGFGMRAWEEFEAKLRAKSRFSAKLQRLENFYLSRAAECAVDGSGRILLPPHLRSYAGIEKDVTFTASIHGFRIWNSKVWEMIFSQAESALLEDPNLFADIDI